jgi:pimeloyl-ACP methyl ester carboxylesterase
MSTHEFITIDGVKFHYWMEGKGPALVFLHAGIADLRMWADQIAAFKGDHRVLAYDIRGYGYSDAPKADFSHTTDLLNILDTLGIEHAALVGCSMSGETVIDFALAHPERVSHLAVVCALPAGYEFKSDPPPIWNELVETFKSGDLEKTNRLETDMWIVGYGRERSAVEDSVYERVLEMNGRVLERDSEQEGKNQRLDPKAVEHLDQLTMPLCVITGQYDEPEITSGWADLLSQVPQAIHHVMPTGHLPNLEQPTKFDHLLREFLAQPSK